MSGGSLVLAVAVAAALAIMAVGPAEAAPSITAKQIETPVFPPTGDTPKAAPFERSAGVGDRIRITLTTHEALEQAPRI